MLRALAPLARRHAAQLERKLDVLSQRPPRIEIVGLGHVSDGAIDSAVPLCRGTEFRPVEAGNSPTIRFINVDLPQPDGPTMVRNSRSSIVQIGFEQRLHAPAFGAEDVSEPLGSRSRTGRETGLRRLAAPSVVVCGVANCSPHSPVHAFRAHAQCRESPIILSSAGNAPRYGAFARRTCRGPLRKQWLGQHHGESD